MFILIVSIFQAYNLGSGEAYTVIQLVKIFESVTKTNVKYTIEERREGDIVSMYADGTLAKNELGWKPKYSIQQMCNILC